ncbi:MAG: branched-chain amino acid transaminase [Alphaproteobacteria bacterium]|nr:branched-chain amino acid transaminase [Alphaproteobacteria bacterium]
MIPIDDRDGFIWMDGTLHPWRAVSIHVLTHGMHYGGCVFEGERAYDGRVFKLREHTKRLFRSADLLGMQVPYTMDEIDAATAETLAANKLTDAYIRPVIWRGSKKMGLAPDPADIRVAIACWSWGKYLQPKDGPGTGLSLKTSRWRRMDPQSFPVEAKAAGVYAVGILAQAEAAQAGFDDALMLDLQGNVAEATVANLFAVFDGVLKTPKPGGFLNGITRQTVIALARDKGITVEECVMTPAEFVKADEMFLTGTAAEIESIGRIDDHKIPLGPMTKQLQEAYSALVRRKG